VSPAKKKPHVECLWVGCNAWAVQRRLCRLHYTYWPYFRYLRGDAISETRIRRDGYVEAMVDHIWALEHRLVMTRIQGRLLESYEIVSWKDGDKTNNAPENLFLTDRASLAAFRREVMIREEG
jgi:hypothetical protein